MMTFVAEGENVTALVHQAIGIVLSDGISYVSGPLSMNAGNEIIECLNATILLKNPRRRIFSSNVTPPIFNPALAAARLLYLLSGSNKLEPIEFYSASASRFSDDGITISGSSYGHRIFAAEDHQSQFAACAELIRGRSRTKRAVLSIYSASDTGRISKDIPCALSIVFIPRDKLDVVAIMRANDVLKLLPYNIFEFTFLAECMAAHTGLELGAYYQFSVSLHLRDDGIRVAQQVMTEVVDDLGEMAPVTLFSEQQRIELIDLERNVRERRVGVKDIEKQVEGYDEVWFDLFSALALEADRLNNEPLETIQTRCRGLIARHRRCPLVQSYSRYLDLIKGTGVSAAIV